MRLKASGIKAGFEWKRSEHQVPEPELDGGRSGRPGIATMRRAEGDIVV